MERNYIQELKVGIFVLFFIFVVAAAVFVLGGSSDMFAQTYSLHTAWRDVKGMKVGAMVRVAGVDVGEVSKVEFLDAAQLSDPNIVGPALLPEEEPRKPSIYLEMKIREEFQERIRADSTATISQVGLLGDMYITISVGGIDKEVLPNGAYIGSAEAIDFLSYAEQATEIVENAGNISKKVDLMLGTEESAKNAKVSDSLAHIEQLLDDAKDGKGILSVLVYDEKAGASIKRTVLNIESLSQNFLNISQEVRSGDGMANALIYGDDGKKLVSDLDALADTLEGAISDIKNNDSLAHAVLYDPEKAKIMSDLADTAASLRSISVAVQEGDGTAGLLVNDPQLYEDLRSLVGGAERSALLRAYIRTTVARGREETAGAPGEE